MDELVARRRTFLIHNLLWFWPIANNGDDVQRLTLIGYWVYTYLALQNLYVGLAGYMDARLPAQRWTAALISGGVVLFYFLGANGLRLRSVTAALMMTVVEIVDLVAERVREGHFPVGTSLITILLLIVLRGIYLAARWERTHGPSEPLAYNAWFGPSVTDRWPRALWLRFRILFWILGSLMLGQSLLYFYVRAQAASAP